MTYLLLKLLHILGVIAFLGNITTGLFWASMAHRDRDFRLIASTFRSIIKSDRWFTIPGVWIILIGGFAAAIIGQIKILATGWILWPIVLFSVSGIVFSVVLGPLQKNIAQFVEREEQSEENWAAYEAMYQRWERWGLIALLAPVLATVIMVVKPDLPGL